MTRTGTFSRYEITVLEREIERVRIIDEQTETQNGPAMSRPVSRFVVAAAS